MKQTNRGLIIVTPVYNDWDTLHQLITELEKLSEEKAFEIQQLVVVDDGSEIENTRNNTKSKFPITKLRLNNNMGHQRALAIGLCYVEEQFKAAQQIIVMDSDGEDRPKDIVLLLKQDNIQNQTKVIFAKRKKRTESGWFKGFYWLYKQLFKMLTGQRLDFGNFSCIPESLLKSVVSIPELWNHYSGGIIKSRIPYMSVGTDRGKRYAGKSKMNFQNLVLHGMSAIAIYLDVVSVRLLLGALLGSGLVVLGLLAILYLRVFTELPIPGWSSITGLILINILAIGLLTTFLILLFQLNQKNSVKLPPKTFYKEFILSISSVL